MNFRSGYLSQTSIFDIINWVTLAVGLIGLQGYVYKIRYFSEPFWKMFFPFFLLWSLVYLWWIWSRIALQDNREVLFVGLGMVFVLSVPQFIALYRYGVNWVFEKAEKKVT